MVSVLYQHFIRYSKPVVFGGGDILNYIPPPQVTVLKSLGINCSTARLVKVSPLHRVLYRNKLTRPMAKPEIHGQNKTGNKKDDEPNSRRGTPGKLASLASHATPVVGLSNQTRCIRMTQ